MDCCNENNIQLNIEQNKKPRRVMLTVAYDGTNYHGWQLQPESITIEKVLNTCLSELLNEEIQVIGASRTDSGVHALCNKAVFDTCSRIPADKFPFALNSRLPEDVRIVKGEEVALDFHPRHCDTIKTYEYHILNTQFEMPNKRLYTYHFYMPLDEVRMNEGGKYLIGEHDFTSFCSVNAQSETRVRTITDVNVRREKDEIIITVTGTGFLYNMVRIIAGTLIDVGRGHIEPEKVKEMLEARDREAAGPTAPAHGLLLAKYTFL